MNIALDTWLKGHKPPKSIEWIADKLGCAKETIKRLHPVYPPKKRSFGIALSTVTELPWEHLFPANSESEDGPEAA